MALGLGLSYAIAWTGPSGTPSSGGNISLPLTSSGTYQYKTGNLILGAAQSIFQKACTSSSSCPAPTLDVEGSTIVGYLTYSQTNPTSEVKVWGDADLVSEPNYNPFSPFTNPPTPPTLNVLTGISSDTLKNTNPNGFAPLCADSKGGIELQPAGGCQ